MIRRVSHFAPILATTFLSTTLPSATLLFRSPALQERSSAARPLMQELAEGRRATAEATRACEAKDWATCLDALDRAIARRPGHPTLLLQRARALAQAGRGTEALSVFERLAAMGLVFPIEDPALATLKPPEQARLTEVRSRVARNGAPTGERQVGFTLPGPNDMVPEGLAWDPKAGVFYVGGVHRPGIVRVTSEGRVTPFVEGAAHGLRSVLGLAVAPRAGRLYVASSALAETAGIAKDEIGRSSLLAFDLTTGRPAGAWPLPVDGTARAFGDLGLDTRERPLLTDSRTGAVYTLRSDAMGLETIVAAGTLASPQGVVAMSDGRTLVVADYALGLVRVDRDSGRVARLDVPETVTTLGIDGLVQRHHELIAVQNGVRPQRVLGLTVDAAASRVTAARVLQANLEGYDEPTLGVIRGDELFYVANSHWNRFEEARLPAADQLSPPLILRVRLR